MPEKSHVPCGERSGMETHAKLMRVIEVQTVRGQGTEASPRRIVTQYFSLTGTLLAERDPLMPVQFVARAEMFDWRAPGYEKLMMSSDEDE